MLVRSVKFLLDAPIPFSNKALGIWGLNEELRDAQKQYLGGRDYSHTWIITEMSHPTLYSKRWLWWHDLHPAPNPLMVVLLGILDWGVVPGSPNPDLIAGQKISFSTRFQTRSLKSIPFFWTWPNLACSRLSDSWGDFPVFSRFIFVFALSQFTRPNYLGAWNRLGLIRQKFCYHYEVRAETKKISKCISNSHISISFLFIWNWNDKYVHSCMLP